MNVNDFDFFLPESQIAQTPYIKRDEAKLLVMDRKTGSVKDTKFYDIINYLNEGDCLVLNDTKVIPARIYGKKKTGANCEVLLLKDLGEDTWEAMVRPGGKLKVGAKIYFGNLEKSGEELSQDNKLEIEIVDILEDGLRKVKLKYDGILNEILDEIGLMPLPPYITEELEERESYQTVYAKHLGSAAAPTAGLHFTNELLEEIRKKGVNIVNITLHVGIGTFRPVKVENVLEHKMHSEEYEITEEAARIINEAKSSGKKIITVGTTSTRTLESCVDSNGNLIAKRGSTDIFIYPGYKFKIVDSIITNFHLPKSTLVMLVSAFTSKEKTLDAYNHAISKGYKFFSFGDAMFING